MSNTEELRNLITKIQNVTKQNITETNEARPKRYLGVIDLDDPEHADMAGLVDRYGVKTTPHREPRPATPQDDPAHADTAGQKPKYGIKENEPTANTARGSSQGKLNIQMTPELQALMRKYGV